MRFSNLHWEEKQGKDGYDDLFIKTEDGQLFQMAAIHPSKLDDPEMGVTMAKRNMNYGLGERFIPQEDKRWNMTPASARREAEAFANQQIEMAHQLTGVRTHEFEHAGVGENGRAPDTDEHDHSHDR